MGDSALGSDIDRFQHEAVFYRDLDEFASATVPFIRDGLELREPVLVAALPDRISRLRSALAQDAHHVTFMDMAAVGGNPARIIPVWRRFVHESVGPRPARGIGEPVWSGRRDVEIEECRLHESLLNVAFDGGPAWRLMCPYDSESLPDAVLEDARRTHPAAGPVDDGCEIGYAGHRYAEAGFASGLPPVPGSARRVCFGHQDLVGLRSMVRAWALEAGMSKHSADHLVLAAHELATNSVEHGGGSGVLQAWTEPGAFVVDISDEGRISDPLVGRDLALDSAEGGRGVWIAHQVCDLLQIRSSEAGTVARLHFWL